MRCPKTGLLALAEAIYMIDLSSAVLVRRQDRTTTVYNLPTKMIADPTHIRKDPQRASAEHELAPVAWKQSATSSEFTLHQLAPYIGKLKSTIARDLIDKYSKPGDVVVDPFSGSGTIPLEAVQAGRRVVASDVSSYAATLTQAKLSPPSSLSEAHAVAEMLLSAAEASPQADLRKVPKWVRGYFHPRTLRESIAFSRICHNEGNHFLMACLLGILHHQRPGFLSYPSSHLVPYLRDRKYPRSLFPEMYAYRPLRPRLLAKVDRAYRRAINPSADAVFRQVSVETLTLSEHFDAMITSPPYMNALDYARDNRLRLWFLDEHLDFGRNDQHNSSQTAFTRQMVAVAQLNEVGLAKGGRCVLVVGESVGRSKKMHPAQQMIAIFQAQAPSLVLEKITVDSIPDIRRSRREYRGVKEEQIIVFRKVED
ncbi:MAG: DNA methyltransferase [Terracidiphilus sp.]